MAAHIASGYSRLQIALHWLVAALIVGAYFTDGGMGRVLHERLNSGTAAMPLHVWLGSAALILIVLRVAVRAIRGAPKAHGPAWMALAAAWGHRLLYVLMIAAPAAGAAAWYLGVTAAADVHGLIANALMLVALAHAVIAIAHQLLLRDGTLLRMTRARS